MRVRTVPVTVAPTSSAARRSASPARACSSRTTRRSTTTSSSVTSSLVMRQVICLADEGFELGGVARAAAAGGHEGADADVDAEAALDHSGDGAGDGDLLGERALDARPVAGLRDAEARELVVALFVAAGDGDGEACRRASLPEHCRERQNAAERLLSCSRCRG